MPRSYMFWTVEEEQLLRDMIAEEKPRKEIYATFYPRSISAIKYKIKKLGLSGHIEYGMNEYIVDGNTTKIIMRDKEWNAYECLIDTEDMEFVLSCGRWHIAKRNNGLYATVGICHKEQYLHRLIMNCPKGMVVDHINGNTLDCRKENMRIITHGQNRQNQHVLHSKNTSGYRGVSWCKANKRWRAVVKLKGKQICNKYFKDKEEAHEYVVAMRAKYMPYSEDARGVVNL